MKIPRILLAILLLAVIALAALIQTFNRIAGENRDLVRQELQKVLGKELNFDGLEVVLLGRPGFSVKNIRMADDPRFAATPLVQAKELLLGVRLWELLWGRIVIDALVFKDPEIQIITDESGLLNLATLAERKKELRLLPQLRPAAPERGSNPVSFAIHALRIQNGRVEYLDRSIPIPAELQVRNINLEVRGFDPTQVTRIRVDAALTEGLNQDVRIDAELAPQADKLWSQRPINLSLRFDSLHLPVIARAIAALRDRIPRALEVTGPMALQAQASGTIEHPRINDFTLKIPLFGSSDYNAIATGSIDFSDKRSWAAARLQGELKIASMDFDRLRNLPFVQQLLPAAVTTDGPLGFFSRFEGTWSTLRIGALLIADKCEVRVRDWLRKPVNLPAAIRARLARQNETFHLHSSELSMGGGKVLFTGSVNIDSTPRLRLEMNSIPSAITVWNQFFPSAGVIASAGNVEWRAVLQRRLSPDPDWNLEGQLKLSDGQFKPRYTDRRIDDVNAAIVFAGKQARIDRATFRVGTAKFALSGSAHLFEPILEYRLRSDQVNLTELPGPLAAAPLQLSRVSGSGRVRWEGGQAVLSGSFTAADGRFQWLTFKDFRADAVWSAAGLAFNNLSAKTFDGTVRSEGSWSQAGDRVRRFQASWQADALNTRPLIGQLLPPLGTRLEGRLGGRVRLDATTDERDHRRNTFNGSGETSIDRGVIRDFNLVRQVLLRGSGAVNSDAASHLPAGFVALVNQMDTPFDSIKANFVVDGRKIHSENLIMTTADYSITGAGWIDADRSTKWNGSIVLSPRLTQELQRDYRMLRYLLDRRSRLSIGFRVDGSIPDVKIRLESRALAQLLRGGTAARDGDADEPGSDSTGKKKRWLPDALERLLRR